MKIRVYEEKLMDFILEVTGRHYEDAESIVFEFIDSMIYAYDDIELLHNFVEPSTGRGSHVSLFKGDPNGNEKWTIVEIESKTDLVKYLQQKIKNGELELPSGNTKLIPVSWGEVSPRSVKVAFAKFPKISGFTDDIEEVDYVYDQLEEDDEYVINDDDEEIVNFIIKRNDNRELFYLSFEDRTSQVSVLSPVELAETINEILEYRETEHR